MVLYPILVKSQLVIKKIEQASDRVKDNSSTSSNNNKNNNNNNNNSSLNTNEEEKIMYSPRERSTLISPRGITEKIGNMLKLDKTPSTTNNNSNNSNNSEMNETEGGGLTKTEGKLARSGGCISKEKLKDKGTLSTTNTTNTTTTNINVTSSSSSSSNSGSGKRLGRVRSSSSGPERIRKEKK